MPAGKANRNDAAQVTHLAIQPVRVRRAYQKDGEGLDIAVEDTVGVLSREGKKPKQMFIFVVKLTSNQLIKEVSPFQLATAQFSGKPGVTSASMSVGRRWCAQ